MVLIMDIMFLKNCGLLLSGAHSRIVIDGFNGRSDCFDCLSDEEFADFYEGKERFDNVRALIFTHKHSDHFDERRVGKYMEKYRDCSLITPENITVGTGVRGVAGASGDPGDVFRFTLDDFEISLMDTGHSGQEYADVLHCSILIKMCGKTVYVAGDSDYARKGIPTELKNESVDIAFFNPFYLSTPGGRRQMTEINSKINYIYHLPIDTDDVYGLKRLAQRNAERYEGTLPALSFLPENMVYIR